jgi:NADH-quinone oxidoreductase subunit C
LDFQQLKELLIAEFGEQEIKEENPQALQPCIVTDKNLLSRVCTFLHTDSRTYFDFLASVTGIDQGPDKGLMEVIYHLYSIPYDHRLTLKVYLQRDKPGEALPSVPSVTGTWKGADWQEREIFDMFGIVFEGHKDLRRILLPEDWEGYPLRKDYKEQEYYHGIKVRY